MLTPCPLPLLPPLSPAAAAAAAAAVVVFRYVMRLDQILNGIALIFVCGEVLLAIFIILAVLSLKVF